MHTYLQRAIFYLFKIKRAYMCVYKPIPRGLSELHGMLTLVVTMEVRRDLEGRDQRGAFSLYDLLEYIAIKVSADSPWIVRNNFK